MSKLAIVVGHRANSAGATAVPPIAANEYEWNSDLAEKMAAHAASVPGADVLIFTRDDGGIVGAYRKAKEWGADGAIELHFNSAGPSASGTETLYLTPPSRPFAEAVQDATTSVLGLRDRGIKTPHEASGGRGTQNLSQMGVRPSILTEPFFGSNTSDCQVAKESKPELARAQLEAAVNFLASMDNDEIWEVTADVLNVRGGPGTDFARLAWGPLRGGDQIELLSREGEWALVASASGQRGYVHTAFIA